MPTTPFAHRISDGLLTGQSTDHLVSHQQHFIHQAIEPDFLAMQQAAKVAGFELCLASGFRSFERQQMIWDNKFNGLRPILDHNSQPLDPELLSDKEKIMAILRWSALPGASRHHWGTDIDIYARNCLPVGVQLQLEPWEYQDGGHQAELTQWLTEHMAKYGFYLPYKNDLGGVSAEPWHLSYHTVSQPLLQHFTLELLHRTINQSQVAGKSQILANLDSIYNRFIINICEV
ncbi:M15 family metallopeptidase [Photobacterium sanguinicancri]|uniref:M15 family metallopeptidase n=1 Tax=Photobacterium sanguinicancri TaxID=875932 RepID=UPI003D148C81